MRLAPKLSLLLAGASVAPLLLATLSTLPQGRVALRAQLDAAYASTAKGLADETQRTLEDRVNALSLAVSALPLHKLEDPQVRQQALRLIYQQTRDADVVGLFTAEGEPVVDPVSLDPAQGHHESIDDDALVAYARNVPLKEALQGGRVVGPPYVHPGPDGMPVPRVVVAVAVPGPEGQAPMVLAMELSLRTLAGRFAQVKLGETGHALLVDTQGKVLFHPEPDHVASRTSLVEHLAANAAPRPERLSATAEVPLTGWKAVVEQSTAEALAPINRQLQVTLLWIGLGVLAALALGLTTVRAVTGPVGKLTRAAAAVAGGDLEQPVEVSGKDELAQLGAAFNDMTRGLRERARLKQTFSRYVSDPVAERILSESSDLDLPGEQIEVTVLFLDIRGFTALSERNSPRKVIDLLNAYFEGIVDVVGRHDGFVNKFIGDAIMAVFGVPKGTPNPERRAVAAAIEIQQAVAAVSARRREEWLEVAHFGIGVNTGMAIAGNIGSKQRMEYTVIGDAVNLAQRLQSQAAAGEVLISRATLDRIGQGFAVEARGTVAVKGRKEPVEMYRLEISAPADQRQTS